jgi:surface polysaccharide O-acyltransferase-like enzyme
MNSNKNIIWLDNLRILSTLAVVIIHSSVNILFKFEKVSLEHWWVANFYDGFFRFCVPIFVMLSGALILPKEEEIPVFLKKSFQRILLPFFFWHSVYMFFNWQVRYRGKHFNFDQGLAWIIKQFQGYSSYHFWYIYMLIGLYLFIPIIGKWIRKASEREIEYFLGIWLISLLINYSEFWGFSATVKLPYFSGYLGYLVLGYYLRFKNFHPQKTLVFSILAIILGSLITLFGAYWETAAANKLQGAYYLYFAPGVVLSTIGVFLFFKYQTWVWNFIKPFFAFVSQMSYGIYMAHIMVLFYLAKIGVYHSMLHPIFGIPLTAFVCLCASGVVVYVLRKIPFVGKWIAG